MPRPLEHSPRQKLEIIRRLDCFHPWSSLDQQRRCRRCGAIFTGAQIEIEGGARGGGPLRLHCPTESCCAVPIEWMLLEEEIAPLAGTEAPSQRGRRSHRILSFLRVAHPAQ